MPNPLVAVADTVPTFFVLLTLILGSVVLISLVLVRFKQSLLVGYFLCGLVLANSGILQWAGADSSSMIHALSELGVILLLFTLGIEFSVDELKQLKRPAFLGGSIQLLLCTIAGTAVSVALGVPVNYAVAIGFAVALSSTAVSIKTFQDMGQPESPQARVALGIALFQDLAVILFMVLLPTLLGNNENPVLSLGLALAKGLAFCVAVIVLSRFGIPQILNAVATTRSRELFTVTIVGLGCAVAVASGTLGLSPALGAFAAGVVVSGSIYSHRVLADVLPFKDLFLTVFFVSIGLLIDVKSITENWLLILSFALLIIIGKGVIVAIAAYCSGLRMGNWLTTAAALCSTGEFSIVLLNRAGELGALTPLMEQILLVCTALTMGLVPSLMKWSVFGAKWLRGAKPSSTKSARVLSMGGKIDSLSDHVIICGYGPVGRNLHENLHRANIRVAIIEMNADTVKELISRGVTCIFADAGQRIALELAHIKAARAIAFTFPHKEPVLTALPTIREMSPQIVVYARTKFSRELEELTESGVNQVILDEEQSGRALIQSVMQCYQNTIKEEWIKKSK
ncbi:MAG: cation:proton antiporter [Akkermansiaceae bacterium]|nr:cation:proton antiporter [Akkermansiaceae bacterium]